MELLNFRNIKEFKHEFTGGVYLITGENEVGKTTLLNAITMLLTGDRSSNLLKKGEEKGYAKIKIGEYEVEIRFTEKNPRGTLTITAENGMRSDNKSMLQDIFEYSDFDAHQFTSWSNTAEGRRKQVALVKSLLSKENVAALQDIDEKIKAKKDEGTEINSSYTATKSIVDHFTITDSQIDEYSEEQSIKKLYEEKQAAQTANDKIHDVNFRADERKENIKFYQEITKAQLITDDLAIKELQDKLMKLTNDREVYVSGRDVEYKELIDLDKQAEEWMESNKLVNIEAIDFKIDKVDIHNTKHSEVKAYKNAKSAFDTAANKKDNHKEELATLLNSQDRLIKTAEIPIEGLSFTEDGLFLNGIPFAPGEISTSQEMEVAAKLMIAKNPTTKVFKITQGESLGEAKLKAIVEFANKNGYQGFIENVSRGQAELMVTNYTVV